MMGRGELPRAQAGGRPQHLLVTILGDYWFDRAEHLPSAALVDLLAEFDVSEAGARAALSRLAKRGLLQSSKHGRHTAYGLSAGTSDLLARGLRRILSFGAQESTWDGRWTVAAFSVPEEQRDLRHALRSRLRWLGLASLYDGVWVSPHPVADDVVAVLEDLKIATATVFVAEHLPHSAPAGDPARAWDLDGLQDVYAQLIERHRPLLDRARSGKVGSAEALVARTALMDTWRTLPNVDPELPPELLRSKFPRASFPRAEARAVFVELYDHLAPLAEARVRQVVGAHDPDLGRLVRAHDSTLPRG